MIKRVNNVIQKSDVDNLIRVRKKYWETGDTDFLDASRRHSSRMSMMCFDNDIYEFDFCNLVDSCIKIGKCNNKKIYEIFEKLGFKIESEEEK